MQGEKSRWPLFVGGTAAALLALLVLGSVLVKRRMDQICVDVLALDLEDLQARGKLPFEPEVFGRCLAVLEGASTGSFDAERTQMMLPAVRVWFYEMGFTTIPVSPAQADDLGTKAAAVLSSMVGQDFGRDAAKWRSWQAARERVPAK
jgi:hypothetical protein